MAKITPITTAGTTKLTEEKPFRAGIDDIVVGTMTAYGLCIAAKLSRKTAKEAIKCYRQSKADNPDANTLAHAMNAGACVASKGNVMKETATDALVDCLKLPKDDDDDEGAET